MRKSLDWTDPYLQDFSLRLIIPPKVRTPPKLSTCSVANPENTVIHLADQRAFDRNSHELVDGSFQKSVPQLCQNPVWGWKIPAPVRQSWRAEQLLHLPPHRGQETHWRASQTSWKQTAHNSFLCGPPTSNCAEESTHSQPCRNQPGLVVLPGRRLRWFAPWKNGERVRPPDGRRSGRSANLQASANSWNQTPRTSRLVPSLKIVPQGCPCIHFSPVIVKNRNGLLSILISVALNGEDASKLHLEKNVRSVQIASKSTNLRPGTQKTFGRKNTVSKRRSWAAKFGEFCPVWHVPATGSLIPARLLEVSPNE